MGISNNPILSDTSFPEPFQNINLSKEYKSVCSGFHTGSEKNKYQMAAFGTCLG